MKKLYGSVLVLALLLAATASTVLAAPLSQGGGDVHFGAFTLKSGATLSEDLIVFGGPATLEAGAVLQGDLTVFGASVIKEGAILEGEMVSLGAAEIAGEVEGSVFSAGAVRLLATAHVLGDVSALGTIDQEDGAVVEGTITPSAEGFGWTVPEIGAPGPTWKPSGDSNATAPWWRAVRFVFRGAMSVVLMALLALVVVNLWPVHTERVGRVMTEAPLMVFGVGLLTLILTALICGLLVITICLSPFAVVAAIVVGVGILFGWVAMGLALGRRILTNNGPTSAKPAVAAVVGTVIITSIAAGARVFGPLYGLMLFLLAPLAAGAVLLTRFGTMPYATTGTTSGTRIPPQGSAPAPALVVHSPEAQVQNEAAENNSPQPPSAESEVEAAEGPSV